MCFFAGGMRFSEQGFGMSAAQLNSSLLSISVIAVLLPAAFHLSVNIGTGSSTAAEASDILKVSHGVRCSSSQIERCIDAMAFIIRLLLSCFSVTSFFFLSMLCSDLLAFHS